MKKVEEIIIVEGVHDISFLKTFLDAYFIKTDGSSIPQSTIDEIKALKEKGKSFIILTDPDFPGEKIRTRLLEIIPNAKLAFLDKKKARTTKKVGVEHSSKEHVLDALNNLISYENYSPIFTVSDLFELGLNSAQNGAFLREKVGLKLKIGKCNAKQFLNRINMLRISKEELKEVVEECK